KGIKTAKDAQLAFNLATKMNPLGLAAAGVAALVAAITIFANKTKSAQDIIADLNESVSKFSDSGKEVERLAGEYETLRGKAERTKDENDRLNTVMEALSKSVPGVVTEFDEYGRALDVNIGKVKEFSEAQKEAAKIQLTKQIEEAQKAVEKLDKKLAPLQRVFQEGITSSTIATATGGTRTIERRANEDEIDKAAERANKIYSEREQILESISQAQKALNDLTAEPPKTEPDDEDPADALEEFKKGLDERKKAYDDYNDAVRNARDEDRAAVKGYYSELIKDGDTYKEYLEGLLRDSRNNVEATTAIYLAAAKANVDLVDDRAKPIKGRPRLSPATSKAQSIAPSNQDMTKLREAQQRYNVIYERIRNATESQQKMDLAGNMIEAAYAGQDLASAIGQFDKGLGEGLSKMADITGSIGNVVGAFSSGDPIAMVSGVASLIGSIGSLFDNTASKQRQAAFEAEKLRQLFELQNRALERQVELMNQASGEDRVKEERATVDLIKKQQKETLDRIRSAKITIDTGIDILGKKESFTYDVSLNLTEGNEVKELEEMIQKATEDGYKIKNQDKLLEMLDEYYRLQGLQKDVTENIVGTTSGNIADAIVQGFKDGKSAIEDFADTFEDTMIDAIMNSFKTQVVMAALEPFYAELASRMEDGELDASDISYLQGLWKTINKGLSTQFEGLKDVITEGLGYDPFADTADTSLSGAIKGVSEETASILAGQMNAMRINQAESLRLMNESARYWAEIAANTSYNRYLEGIHSDIKAMRSAGSDLKAKGF
ncbi:MAG TPA: hypothetical protein VFF56_06195, partial [Bacillota bacterium]|nr:hypothetical protein [Bacillota bacterium]